MLSYHTTWLPLSPNPRSQNHRLLDPSLKRPPPGTNMDTYFEQGHMPINAPGRSCDQRVSPSHIAHNDLRGHPFMSLSVDDCLCACNEKFLCWAWVCLPSAIHVKIKISWYMYCSWCRSPSTSKSPHHIVNHFIRHLHFRLHALGGSCYRSIWSHHSHLLDKCFRARQTLILATTCPKQVTLLNASFPDSFMTWRDHEMISKGTSAGRPI